MTRRAIAAHNPLPFLRLSASRARNHHPLPLNKTSLRRIRAILRSPLLLCVVSPPFALLGSPTPHLQPPSAYIYHSRVPDVLIEPCCAPFPSKPLEAVGQRDVVVVVLSLPFRKFISLLLYTSRTFHCSVNFPTLPSPFHLAGHLRQTL